MFERIAAPFLVGLVRGNQLSNFNADWLAIQHGEAIWQLVEIGIDFDRLDVGYTLFAE